MCVAYYVLDLGGASCLTYRDGDCIDNELEERSSSCSAGGGLAGDPGSRLPQDCVVQGAGGCRMVGHLVLFILLSWKDVAVNNRILLHVQR